MTGLMGADRFRPAKNYAALKKQALALHRLLQAQQGELSLLRKLHDLVSRYETYQALLDSEREANAMLTERVLALEAALERASDQMPSKPRSRTDNSDLVIEYDQDGYPTEATLDAIAGFRGSPEQLLEAVSPLFTQYGRCERKGDTWIIATGGWSGCESVIRAMQKNHLFWGVAWCLSKRGGYYEFDLGEVCDG